MELEEAFAALGLALTATRPATPEDIRTAFRERVRHVHPDAAGTLTGSESFEANHRTQQLIEAYRVALANAQIPQEPPVVVDDSGVDCDDDSDVDCGVDHDVDHDVDSGGDLSTPSNIWLVGPDTVALRCTHEEAFALMIEVGHRLGSITYLDRQGELLEVLLRTVHGDSISLVISFQGRLNRIEAFLTAELLDRSLDRAQGPIPPIEQLTELVVYHLNAQWHLVDS